MKKFIKIYDKFEEIALVSILALITALCFLQVIMRYAFDSAFPWVEEFCTFLMVWSAWLGMSIGQRKGEHIKITLLTDKLSNKTAHVLNIIADIIVIALCGATAYWGIMMAQLFWNSSYASIPVSMGVAYIAIPTGCILMILRLLPSVKSSFSALAKGKEGKDGEPI